LGTFICENHYSRGQSEPAPTSAPLHDETLSEVQPVFCFFWVNFVLYQPSPMVLSMYVILDEENPKYAGLAQERTYFLWLGIIALVAAASKRHSTAVVHLQKRV